MTILQTATWKNYYMSDIHCSFSIPLASILTVPCGWYHCYQCSCNTKFCSLQEFWKI